MLGGSAADRGAAEQLRGNQFRRPPNGRIGQEMFDLIEQAPFETGDLFLATGATRGDVPHGAQVLSRSRPRIFAGATRFRGDSAEQDEDFDLGRIVGRPGATLLQLALPQPQLIGQDADALHAAAERQRDDGMSRLVVRRRDLVRRLRG